MAKDNKLQTKIPTAIILFLVSLVTFAQTSDNWRLATWSDETAHYYDPSRITRPKPNIIRVWIRVDRNWKSNQIEKSIELTEFHCSERKIRKLQTTKYDSNDKVLSSISSESSSWSFVIPDTIGERLLEIFCFGKEDAQAFSDAQDYYDEAEKLADNKRFAEAIPLYKKAIALQPKYIFYHLSLSEALSELKQYELAVFHANKAIEFSDSNNGYLAYQNLGEIYEKQKKFDFAIQAYKRAINLRTDCISLCEFYVERLYKQLNRNLELLAFYEERLQVRPSDIELLLKLGDLQKKLRNV